MTRYQLTFASGTAMQGQPVMGLQFLKLDDAKSVADRITRATGLAIDVLAIKIEYTTTVIANGNIIQ